MAIDAGIEYRLSSGSAISAGARTTAIRMSTMTADAPTDSAIRKLSSVELVAGGTEVTICDQAPCSRVPASPKAAGPGRKPPIACGGEQRGQGDDQAEHLEQRGAPGGHREQPGTDPDEPHHPDDLDQRQHPGGAVQQRAECGAAGEHGERADQRRQYEDRIHPRLGRRRSLDRRRPAVPAGRPGWTAAGARTAGGLAVGAGGCVGGAGGE